MGGNLGGIGDFGGSVDGFGIDGWDGWSGWNVRNGPRVETWCVFGWRWALGSNLVVYLEVEGVDWWV